MLCPSRGRHSQSNAAKISGNGLRPFEFSGRLASRFGPTQVRDAPRGRLRAERPPEGALSRPLRRGDARRRGGRGDGRARRRFRGRAAHARGPLPGGDAQARDRCSQSLPQMRPRLAVETRVRDRGPLAAADVSRVLSPARGSSSDESRRTPAAASWIVRGDGVAANARGCRVDSPWRRGRGGAAPATETLAGAVERSVSTKPV